MIWRWTDPGGVPSCVVGAISVVSGWSPRRVHERLLELASEERPSVRYHRSSLRHGFRRRTYERLLFEDLGARWTHTPGARLCDDDLPARGRLIVSVKRHLTAVVDRVILDTFDPRDVGKNRVYGYYTIGHRKRGAASCRDERYLAR